MPAISSSAPGKVILCGEHAVVYGMPAIALPVFQVSTTTKIFAKPQSSDGEVHVIAPAISLDTILVTLEDQDPLKIAARLVMQEFHLDHIPACEIHIQTTLPIAAGLGSSASTAVSFTRALSTFLGHPLPDNTINRIAYEVEKHHHGSPSGIDNSVIAYETPVYYQKDRPIETLKIASPFTLVIADSGIKSSTAQAVAGVRHRWEQNRQQYEDWFYEIGQISIDVREYLENGMIEKVGPHLTHNHVLLQKIGVSNSELDNLVEAALTAGALGAKLSGGGLGGNMIALVSNEQTSTVVDALISHGAIHTITTTIPASGGIGHLR